MQDEDSSSRSDAVVTLPVGFVPTPTDSYRRHRKALKVTVQPGAPAAPPPVPMPVRAPAARGTRVLLWKQDPSVSEIGVRKAYLPGAILPGPRDARISSGLPGIPSVSPNAFGDFVQTPGTDAFDAVHTYSVVRQTLTMCQRALAVASAPAPIPWQWHTPANVTTLNVFPHGLPDVMNAYYSRTEKALRFGDFVPAGTTARVYTCRSFDIVAHEAAHAILDGLKPQWIMGGQPPQTGGLHESFGDLVAIFLALSQLDQVEAIVAQTKADLHNKTFLADLAEQFGLALGRPNGLRNADNNLRLSETGSEVHAISQVLTGAIYDILADIFTAERRPTVKDDAATLYEVSRDLWSLVLRSLIAAPASGATFAHVANSMLVMAAPAHRNFIRNHFTLREVVTSPVPLTQTLAAGTELEPAYADAADAVQDRSACCGTMTSGEYLGIELEVEEELQALMRHLSSTS